MSLETVTNLRVRYAETDQMGVVYYAHYLVWCEIGRTDFIRTLGTPYAQLEKEGVLLAVSDAALRYHASARYDDAIQVYTQLSSVRSRALAFSYRIVEAETGTLLVTAITELVSLSPDGRVAALPSPLREVLNGALAQREPGHESGGDKL